MNEDVDVEKDEKVDGDIEVAVAVNGDLSAIKNYGTPPNLPSLSPGPSCSLYFFFSFFSVLIIEA